MPSFRGEDADERHLCQFYHSEAEIQGTLDDVMELVEDYIKYLCERILENLRENIKEVAGTTDHIEKMINTCGNIPKIDFDEVASMLKNDERYIENNGTYRNITKEGEKRIIDLIGGAVWIKKYDYISVPFYQKYDETKTKALNADLLFGIGETVGAGERHYKIEDLEEALELHNIDKKEYEWYCNMKKTYPMQTSGFGMGIERFILWLLKHDDIRDCQILSRFNGKNMMP